MAELDPPPEGYERMTRTAHCAKCGSTVFLVENDIAQCDSCKEWHGTEWGPPQPAKEFIK